MYRRALQVTPNHSNTLYNYAVLLDTHLKQRLEAEGYYRKTIELEPRHAYALYNLAVLCEEQYVKKLQLQSLLSDNNSTASPTKNTANEAEDEILAKRKLEIGDFYRRAAEADPKDVNSLADYGRFLYIHLQNIPFGEQILLAALKLDSTNEVARYHYALLLYK